MTMLDGMRRHKAWLKWSLGLVCLTFVLFYVPSFMGSGQVPGVAGLTDEVASVDGETITAGDYQRLYALQLQQLRQAYGGSMDERMLRQLGVGQRLLSQMVDQAAMVAEADRLGFTVSDAELAERIKKLPTFQQNGQFVGESMYRQILASQRPPVRASEFEEELRRSLKAEKLQIAVTGWVRVGDADVDAEYRKRNEKVKLDLAVLTAAQFRAGIEPTEAEVSARFTANQNLYQVPEKRRVRYLAVNSDQLRDKITVTPAEVSQRYQDNQQQYSTPEQVRASHILLKTEGKDDAAVKKAADAVLAQVKAGGDFAALAKRYSEDDTNKDTGGDLDYFGQNGQMAKEFEDAAFKLQPGQTSDLVKTSFGYHVIKVVDRKAASTRSLSDVSALITEQIKQERAQIQVAQVADQVAAEIKTPADIDKVASARGLIAGDSGLFSREEPMAGLGFVPTVNAEAFTMEKDKVSGKLQTNQGFAFIALTEIQAPRAPKLEEVTDRVRTDVINAKAVELAKAKAATLAQQTARTNFAAAAKAAGVVVKNTELVPRGTALPDIGVSATVDDAIFKLKAGEVSGPIATENAVVVARVVERQDIDPTLLAAEADALRDELIQQRRETFFSAYMMKAKQKMKITYNDETMKVLLGN
jgi:peptidyl-prolyl cis-trans isomerase D